MIPAPWSPSGLSEIENCPKAFHETRVLRRVKGTRTEHNDWGDEVHKAFETYFDTDGVTLPGFLEVHRNYLAKLHAKDGFFWTEQKAAFDKKAKPCSWEAPVGDIFGRFKIDYIKVDMEPDLGEKSIADIRDWKTGKQKDEFMQLIVYALWAFAAHHVDIVDVRYYWTQTQTETRKIFGREEIPALWAGLIPKLQRWRDLFKEDKWPARQSGLCSWCPVVDCEFWKPRRPTR